jgi:Rad3-related DNA helicase
VSKAAPPILSLGGPFEPVENLIVATFGEGGFLSKNVADYKPRRSQMVMAHHVDKTLASVATGPIVEASKSLFVEGPTGCGKSLAYVVPLSYHCARTNQRGLIVTGNNNLLHQIVSKDLPAVRDAVPWKFTFAQLKGLNNYACLSRWESVQHPYHEAQERYSREIKQLKQWVDGTKTGDRNELAVEPPAELWNHMSTTSEGCLGKQCPDKDTCFGFAAKARAHNSQIVVTNYHMLFIDLRTRLRSMGERRVLPPYRFLVLDEAHKASDIARDFFARTASRAEVWRITNAIKKFAETEARELDRAANEFFDRAAVFAMTEEKKGGKEKRNNDTAARRIKDAGPIQLDHKDLIRHVGRARKRAELEADRTEDEEERLQIMRLAWKLESFETDIQEIVGLKDKHAISFVERSGKGKNVVVGSKPATVAAFLGMGLFGRVVPPADGEAGPVEKPPGPDDSKDDSGWIEGGESRSDELPSGPESDPMFADPKSKEAIPVNPLFGSPESAVSPGVPGEVVVTVGDWPGKQSELPLQSVALPDEVDSVDEVDEIDELEGGPPPAPREIDEMEGGAAVETEADKERRVLEAKIRQAFGGRGIICTSATLATPKPPVSYEMFDGTIPDPFDFVTREMGVGEHANLVVESPFDFRRQALLVIPQMPPPERKGEGSYDKYRESMSRALVETVKQAQGRTLGLFTNWSDLDWAAQYIRRAKLPYRVLVQGENPNPALIAEFRKDVNSVLLGTESFFTGIDVQGEALSCVFISKLPFPNPGDPVMEALTADQSSFNSFTVPRTVIVLKQMFGRLIRTTTDRGVVVIADSRLLSEKLGGKSYNKRIIGALPKARRSMNLADIGKFLAGEKVGTIRKEWLKPGEVAEELL